jgi:hypothetical protein
MPIAVLTAQAEQYEMVRGTILFRHDIEIFWNEDINACIQALFVNSAPLWVLFEKPGVFSAGLLDELYNRYPRADLSIIVLAADPTAYSKTGFIRLALPLDFDRDSFNEAAAVALKLPLRRGIRLPVRLSLSGVPQKNPCLATTVNISSVSMLVETLITLDVGSVYEFRFAGIKGTSDLPAISARVAGLVKGPQSPSRLQHYAMEFVGVSKDAMEEILKKIVHA